MYPLPIIFPGELSMRVNLKILRNLTRPLLDTELYMEDSITGNATEVPCIPGTYIGTCQNIDLCSLIDHRNNKTATVDPPSFQKQIDEILTTPLGRHVQCPIRTTQSSDKTVRIALQPLSSAVHKILHGSYMLKLSIKDNPASKDNMGCIKFRFSVADGPPTPPPTFTPTPTTTLGGPLPPSEIIPVG